MLKGAWHISFIAVYGTRLLVAITGNVVSFDDGRQIGWSTDGCQPGLEFIPRTGTRLGINLAMFDEDIMHQNYEHPANGSGTRSSPPGPDTERLQRRILSAVTLVEETEVVVLLGLSGGDPGGSLSRMRDRGEILRLEVDGRVTYPFFQFDARGHRVLPGLSAVLAARPSGWSDYRLLHWLTTPNLELGCTPVQAIGTDGIAVLAAFERECEAPCHG